jgi:hypothetical protein
MKNQVEPLSLDQPATYRIVVQGRLSQAWSGGFDGMAVSFEEPIGEPVRTALTGTVTDQSALYGLLSRIRDLGLPLLSVEYLGHSEGAI